MNQLEKTAAKKKLIEKVQRVLYGKKPEKYSKNLGGLGTALAAILGGAAAVKGTRKIVAMKNARIAKTNKAAREASTKGNVTSLKDFKAHGGKKRSKLTTKDLQTARSKGSLAGIVGAAGLGIHKSLKSRKAMKAYKKRKKIVNTGLAGGGLAGLIGLGSSVKGKKK